MLLVPCRVNPYSTWHRAFVMLLVLELKSNELWLRRCKVINGFKIYLGLWPCKSCWSTCTFGIERGKFNFWRINLIKSAGSWLPIRYFPPPLLIQPSSLDNTRLRERSCFTKIGCRPNANSSFGLYCMTDDGQLLGAKGMVCRMTTLVCFAPNPQKLLIICWLPVRSLERYGSRFCTRSDGILRCPMCKLKNLQPGGPI